MKKISDIFIFIAAFWLGMYVIGWLVVPMFGLIPKTLEDIVVLQAFKMIGITGIAIAYIIALFDIVKYKR